MVREERNRRRPTDRAQSGSRTPRRTIRHRSKSGRNRTTVAAAASPHSRRRRSYNRRRCTQGCHRTSRHLATRLGNCTCRAAGVARAGPWAAWVAATRSLRSRDRRRRWRSCTGPRRRYRPRASGWGMSSPRRRWEAATRLRRSRHHHSCTLPRCNPRRRYRPQEYRARSTGRGTRGGARGWQASQAA